MRNNEKEISQKILRALAKRQHLRFFSKKRLIFSVIASFFVIIVYAFYRINISQKRSHVNANKVYNFNFPMSFCGDRTSGGTNTWYPIYVNYSQENLEKIRQYYCCDAEFSRTTGKIIIASFYNRSKANILAVELKSRGFNSHVGSGQVITTQPTPSVNNCK